MQSLSGFLQKKCSKMCAKIFVAIKKIGFAKKQKQAWFDINTKRFLCSINFVKKVQLCKEHVIWCNCAVRAVPVNDYIETMRVVLHVPGRKNVPGTSSKIISKILRRRNRCKKISIFTKFSMLQKNRLESKNKIWVRNRHKRVKCLLVKSHSQKLLLFFQKNRQKSYEKFQKS